MKWLLTTCFSSRYVSTIKHMEHLPFLDQWSDYLTCLWEALPFPNVSRTHEIEYCTVIYSTSIEARLRRASLLRRTGNGASVTVVQRQRFLSIIIHKFICSNGLPCNDGASSQGKQRTMTVVHRQPCHVSAASNSTSNAQ